MERLRVPSPTWHITPKIPPELGGTRVLQNWWALGCFRIGGTRVLQNWGHYGASELGARSQLRQTYSDKAKDDKEETKKNTMLGSHQPKARKYQGLLTGIRF